LRKHDISSKRSQHKKQRNIQPLFFLPLKIRLLAGIWGNLFCIDSIIFPAKRHALFMAAKALPQNAFPDGCLLGLLALSFLSTLLATRSSLTLLIFCRLAFLSFASLILPLSSLMETTSAGPASPQAPAHKVSCSPAWKYHRLKNLVHPHNYIECEYDEKRQTHIPPVSLEHAV
jgi:hypothetical protein